MPYSLRRSQRRVRGFTLAEVLIAMIILGILGASLTRLLATQSRYYDHENNLRKARMVARSSTNILLADLRMVQDSGGVDSVSSDGKLIRILVPYRFGLVCGVNGNTTTVSMLPADSATVALAGYGGFAWRGPTGSYSYNPSGSTPVASATPALCTGNGVGQAQLRTVAVAGRAGAILDVNSSPPSGATQAAPVFFWQKVTYSFAASAAYTGKVGLWRNVAGATEEIMAPFDTSARFRYYLAGDTVPEAVVPAKDKIRGIQLRLVAISPKATSNTTTPSQANITTSVFFKNVRAF